MDETYKFDEPTLLSAVAIGQPGNRTFFLIIGDGGRWVRAWLEKSQLQTLGLAIDQFRSILKQEHLGVSLIAEGTPLSDEAPKTLPTAEVEIDEIALGYERDKAVVSFQVRVIGPQKADHGLVECHMALKQLKQFAKQAMDLCSAGRPLCPLCGGPMDPSGHVCPKSN